MELRTKCPLWGRRGRVRPDQTQVRLRVCPGTTSQHPGCLRRGPALQLGTQEGPARRDLRPREGVWFPVEAWTRKGVTS